MNAPFVVAQAVTTGQGITTGQNPATPPKVVKLLKPQGEQAIVVNMDGNTRLDFSGIAGEKITLVHVGERLVILFDNKSTVTIDPFFDSSGKPLQLGGIDLDGNRIVSADEFAALFPITGDQSILPAAGGQGGPQNTGGQFATFAIQDLLGDTPLDLLTPEELGNFVTEVEQRPLLDDEDLVPVQTGARLRFNVEEEHALDSEGEEESPGEESFGLLLLGGGNNAGNEDPNDVTDASPDVDPDGLDRDTDGSPDNTTRTFNGTGANALTALISGGTPPLTFTVIDRSGDNVTTETGTVIQSAGFDVVYTNFDNTVPGETSIEGWASGQHIFTLTVESNGDWTFVLFGQLDHPDALFDDGTLTQGALEEVLGIDLTSLIQATDGNGSVLTLSGTGYFVIDVIDDTPIVYDEQVAPRTVSENDIKTLWSLGTSPLDGDADDGSHTGPFTLVGLPASITGDISGYVSFGADGAAATGAFGLAGDALSTLQGFGLQSKGTTLNYGLTGGDTVVASVGSGLGYRLVFTFTLNADGSYEFRLYDQLDHVAPPAGSADENFALVSSDPDNPLAAIDFGSIIVATDGDGDSISLAGKLPIEIRDDIPVVTIVATGHDVARDESAGNQQDDTTQSAVANLFSGVANKGADPDMAHGYARSGLLSPVILAGSLPGADEPRSQTLSLSLTGGNGVDSGLTTTDGKTIYLFVENGRIVGRIDGSGDGIDLDNLQPDDLAAFAIHIDQGGRISIAQFLSLEHPDPTSPNDFVDLGQVVGGAVQAVVTVVDYDDDTVSRSVDIGDSIRFYDDGPKLVTGASVSGAVDEDGLDNVAADGNEDAARPGETAGTGSILFTGGSLSALVNFGADGAGSDAFQIVSESTAESYLASLNLTSGGVAVTDAEIFGNVLTAKAADGRGIFKLTINADSTWTFELLDKVDHPVTLNPDSPNNEAFEDTRTLSLGGFIDAYDGDGDRVNLGVTAVTIVIRDDIPFVPGPAANLIANGDFLLGNWSAPQWWGSQSATADNWSISGTGTTNFERPPSGFLGLFTSNHGQPGAYMIDMGGSPGNLTISQNIAGMQAGQTYAIQFEAGAPFPQTAKLEVLFNGQVIGTIDPSGPGNLTSYNFIVTGAGNPTFDQLTFREIGTGDAPIAQQWNGQNLQTEGYHGTYIANIKTVPVYVVDEDGLPTGNGDSQTGDAATNNAFVTGVLGINWGADNHDGGTDTFIANAGFTQDAAGRSVVFTDTSVGISGGTLTSKGDDIVVSLEANGTRLVGTATHDGVSRVVFEVTLSDDDSGKFHFILRDQLDHAPNGNENDITLTFTYTASDSDNDTATGTFLVGVDDDVPVANGGTQFVGTVYEDTLTGGNAENAGAQPTSIQISLAQLNALVSVGADEQLTFAFNPVKQGVSAGVSSNGFAVTYSISGDTLSGVTADSRTVFTLVKNGNGTFTFTLLDNLDHMPNNVGGGDAETLTLNLASLLTASDYDGDTVILTGALNVNVENDIPVIGIVPGNLIVNGSFEEFSPAPGNGQWGLYSSITGWEAATDVPFEIQVGNVGGRLPQDGNAKVELDSDTTGDTTPDANPNPDDHTNTTIQQTVLTTPGAAYELTFWYSPRPDDKNPGDSSMEVLWNGHVVHAIDSTSAPEGWQKITIVVTGPAGGSAVLAFRGTGSETEYGAYIDNVSLVPIATVDEDGLTGPHSIGNNDSQTGDNVVPDSDFDANESTANGVLGIKWGADDFNGGVDGYSIAGGYTQDGSGRSVTFANATVGITGGTLTSKGDAIAISIEDGGTRLVGTATHEGVERVVFEVTLSDDDSGHFRFILKDQLDHALGDNENDIILSFNFTARDYDGDTATGVFRVLVDDDVPVALDEAVSGGVDESDIGSGAGSSQAFLLDFQSGTHTLPPDLSGTNLNVGGGTGIVVVEFAGAKILQGPDQNPGATALIFTADAGTSFTLESVALGLFGANSGLSQIVLNGYDESNNLIATYTFTAQAVGYLGQVPSTVFNAAATPFAALELFRLELVPPATLAGRIVLDNMAFTQIVPGEAQPDQTIVDLTGLVSVGADDDGTWALVTITTPQNFGGLMHDNVQITITSDGDTLIAQAGSEVVFTLALTDAGIATFTLYQPIDGDTLLELDFSEFVTVTDFDGDTITLNTGQFVINVAPDTVPTVTDAIVEGAVDEDGLGLPQPSVGNADSGRAGETAGTGNAVFAAAAGSLFGLVNFQADGAHADPFRLASEADAETWLLGLNLVSQGDIVNDAVIVGNTLTAKAVDGRDVFKLTVNSDGSWTFELLDQVDHPVTLNPDAPNNSAYEDTISINLGGFIEAYDTDGDHVALGGANLTLIIRDDIPYLAPIAGGSVSAVGQSVNGVIDFSAGADEPGAFSLAQLTSVPGASIGTVTDPDTGIITLTASIGSQVLYTLVVDPAAGTYQFNLVGLPTTATPLNTVNFGAFAPTLSKDFGTFKALDPSGNQNVNGSGTGFGLGDTHLDDGETIRFQFDNQMSLADLHFKQEGSGDVTITWVAFNSVTGQSESGTFTIPQSEAGAGIYTVDILAHIGAPGADIPSFDILDLTASSSGSGKVKIQSLGGTQLTAQDLPDIQFQLTGTDNDLDAATATFTVGIGVNYAPETQAVFASGAEDSAFIAVTLIGSDADAGDSVADFRITSLPPLSEGKLYTSNTVFDASTEVHLNDELTASGNQLVLYFVPVPDFNGNVEFGYAAIDSHGAIDATPGVAQIEVVSVNDAPAADVPDATPSTLEDQPVSIFGFSVGDVDDANLTLTLTATSTLTLSTLAGLNFTNGDGTNDTTMTFSGTIAAINAALNGMLYTPTPNFNGFGSISYLINDGTTTTNGVFNIAIAPVNDAPVMTLSDVSANVTEDSPYYANMLYDWATGSVQDTDGPSPLSISESFIDAVGQGGATVSAALLTELQQLGFGNTFNADRAGSFLYWEFELDNSLIQYLNAGQSITATYRITATDGAGGTSTQDVTVVINGVDEPANVAPVITSAPYSKAVTEDFSFTVPLGDLVGNGSFSSWSGSTGNYSFAGWTISSPGGAVYYPGLGHSNGPGVTVSTAGAGGGHFVLSQSVATLEGVDYTIGFWAAASLGQGNSNSMQVFWNGELVEAFSNLNTGGLALQNYQYFTVDVTGGAGTASSLSFDMTTGQWWLLDDVSVIANVTPGVESIGGLISFTDANLNDAHLISVTTPAGSSYLGDFIYSLSNSATGDGAGGITWTFTVDDADIQHLGQGATLTQTYTVEIDDQNGGVTPQDVTIVIRGVNDNPDAQNDTLSFGSTGGGAGTPPSGADWHYNADNGHYYKFVIADVDWTTAKDAAEAEGGYLATITSLQEEQFVQQYMGNFNNYYWLGASDADAEGTWEWVTGPEAGTVFWTTTSIGFVAGVGWVAAGTATGYASWPVAAAGYVWEPNNGVFSGNSENYLEFNSGFWWNDAENTPGGDGGNYIIEWGGVVSGGNGGVSEDDVTTFSTSLLLGNDTDIDVGDTLTVVGFGLGGTLTATTEKGATVTLDPGTGEITYDPTASLELQALNNGQNTTDSFVYRVSDGKGGFATATATLTVNGVTDSSGNTAPVLTAVGGDGTLTKGQNLDIGSFATALNVDGNFILGADPDIANATTRPHVTVEATGGNATDYYAFTVTAAGSQVTFDIDYGNEGGLDSYIYLYNSAGSLLAQDDDSDNTGQGAGGSTSTLDSYLTYTFATTGTYYIAVGSYPSPSPVPSGATYQLQISLQNAILASPIALDPVAEDAGAPTGAVGTLVSDLVDLPGGGGHDNVTDPDSGAVTGIALTGTNETNGTWWYSLDNGATWQGVGAVSDAAALLLAADAGTRLYFQAAPDFNGGVNAGIEFRAWDRSDGTAGAKVDTTVNGGSTAFSVATDIANISVTPTNDAPVATVEPIAFGRGYAVSGANSIYANQVIDLDAAYPNMFSDVDGDALVWSVVGAPSGFSFNASTRELTFQSSVVPGIYDITVNASDGSESASKTVKVWVAGSTSSWINNANGGAGNDTIIGSNSDNTRTAGDGHDFVDARSGTDTVSGGSGNDVLYGGSNSAFNSYDTLNGGDGNDYLNGNSDNDRLNGDAGDDWLVGEGGNDILSGGSGSDTLLGGNGNDILYGNSSGSSGDANEHDVLFGGAGDDQLYGGNGNDILVGGVGSDDLTGGNHADTFKWLAGDLQGGGVDDVWDFSTGTSPNSDILDLSGLLAGVSGNKADAVRFVDDDGTTRLASQSGNSNLADGDLTLQVNLGSGWTDVAVLHDTGSNFSANNDVIQIMLDTTQQQVTV